MGVQRLTGEGLHEGRRQDGAEPGDTVEALHERIKVVERSLYPRTIRSFAKQRVG